MYDIPRVSRHHALQDPGQGRASAHGLGQKHESLAYATYARGLVRYEISHILVRFVYRKAAPDSVVAVCHPFALSVFSRASKVLLEYLLAHVLCPISHAST